MNRRARLALLAAVLLLAPQASRAYITSAILEYCADDEVAFYLNGSVLMQRSEFGPFDYQVLSTADGTLPLELFKENEENLLGTENFDTEAGLMSVSYRLTVHHSDGDPVVIWSDPDQSRFLHLAKEQPSPLGWNQPAFDDSKWGQAVGVNVTTDYGDAARLEDAAFGGLLTAGYVPYLAHRADSKCRGGDHNLFRSKFRFPNHPAKVEIALNPPRAVHGQPVSVRLIPGPDTTEISLFNLMAWIPKSMELAASAPGASYDPQLRRIHWKTSNRDMKVSYARLHAESVLKAGGWGAPEKLLGAPKPGKARRKRNVTSALYEDGALPTQGAAGWFKLQAPQVDFSQGIPKIQGVIFHTQIKMGGRDVSNRRDVDRLHFNYSVDGRNEGALRSDVNIARTSWNVNWFDGYYHASEDRAWTWDDVRNLRVKIEARQVAQRDKNLIASMTAVVRYYYPNKVAPWFQARVLEARCAELKLQTGVFRHGSKLVSSDPLTIRVNEHLCAPTAAPTAAPTPVPMAIARPQPTPTPQPAGVDIPVLGLGCLTVAPDPLDYSGAFISFCLKGASQVTVNIYDGSSGAGVRRIAAKEFRAGDGQVFFNGLDDEGRLLKPGRYLCELVAEGERGKEARNTSFNMVKKRARR